MMGHAPMVSGRRFSDLLIIKHRASMAGTKYQGVSLTEMTREELMALVLELLDVKRSEYQQQRQTLSKVWGTGG